jgi:hypothetical protein
LTSRFLCDIIHTYQIRNDFYFEKKRGIYVS